MKFRVWFSINALRETIKPLELKILYFPAYIITFHRLWADKTAEIGRDRVKKYIYKNSSPNARPAFYETFRAPSTDRKQHYHAVRKSSDYNSVVGLGQEFLTNSIEMPI
jgi:hypothetical protein